MKLYEEVDMFLHTFLTSPLDRMLGGPQSWCEHGDRKIPATAKNQTLVVRPVATTTDVSLLGLLRCIIMFFIFEMTNSMEQSPS
jgi:hypothetical protein